MVGGEKVVVLLLGFPFNIFWENQLINSYTVVHANITPTYFTCDSLDFLKAPVSGFCWFPVSAGQVPHSLSLP